MVAHLAENADRAKKIATMPAGRAAGGACGGGGSELARVSRAKGGNKRGLGDDVDDKTWERNFKAKYPNGFNPRNR